MSLSITCIVLKNHGTYWTTLRTTTVFLPTRPASPITPSMAHTCRHPYPFLPPIPTLLTLVSLRCLFPPFSSAPMHSAIPVMLPYLQPVAPHPLLNGTPHIIAQKVTSSNTRTISLTPPMLVCQTAARRMRVSNTSIIRRMRCTGRLMPGQASTISLRPR